MGSQARVEQIDPLEYLPYRGMKPAGLNLPLPPAKMPLLYRGRPLKQWRYVGVYGPELSLCAGIAKVGPIQQSFWAVWDRTNDRLLERTSLFGHSVELPPGRLLIDDRNLQADLRFIENQSQAIEVVSLHGRAYIWTRKQGGLLAAGELLIDQSQFKVSATAIVDESAGYHARHTRWQWSAGVGTSSDGNEVAWNLVNGIHDDPHCSERTVWVDGKPHEVGPVRFTEDLSRVESTTTRLDTVKLNFTAESERKSKDNLLIVRSDYRQPFGTFSGQFNDELKLTEGFGVMEHHEAWW